MSSNDDPRSTTAAFSSALILFNFASTATRSAISSAAIRRRVLPATSRGRNVGQHGRGLGGGQVAFALTRQQFAQEALQPVDGLDPLPGELVTAVGEHPQGLEFTVLDHHPQPRGADRAL